MEAVSAQKALFRREVLQKRKQAANPAMDQKIAELLLHSTLYKNANMVLCYVSYGFEIDTYSILTAALADQKIVAVPKCTDFNGSMCFKQIQALSDLAPGAYHIPEPNETCPILSDFDQAICIVPGLAFSKEGYRIGYGKGYYDRFLQNFSGNSIGICYNNFVYDTLPHDQHDHAVQLVITEQSATASIEAAADRNRGMLWN